MATATLKSLTGVSDPLKDLTSKAEEAGRKEQETSSAIQKLEIDKSAAEAQRADVQAKAKVAGTEEAMARQAARETPIKEQKSEVDNALMNEHFKPSKENLQDQAALFSLINVIGFAIGAGGKQNSMQAMYAMNGMLEGHQKGRADLFKEEQVKFEKNFKALQQKANFLESELRHSLEEFTRDKRAADERAGAAFASAGADFMKTYAEKFGLVEAHKRALEVKKSADKAVADYQKEQQRKLDKIEAEGRHLEQMKELRQFGASLKAPTAGGKATAADRYGFGDIVAGASNEAAAAIKNLMGLPFESTSGVFGGKQTNSLFTAPLDAFANTLTSESVQRYNTQSGKLGYNLAQLMSGGRAVRVSDVDQMNKILQIKEGDTLETAATRIAEARQLAERTMEIRARSENTPPGLREVFKENLETVRTTVPFTVDDINEFVANRDKSTTFAQALNKRYSRQSEGGGSTELDSERKNAKAAIQAGAPEEAVRKRFKQKTGQEL